MKREFVSYAAAIVMMLGSVGASAQTTPNEDPKLMQARELVWRAWFAGDVKSLEELLPANTIAISSGDRQWHKRDGILREAAEFHEHGGKLTRLEFPRTEIQRFGDVAVLYSEYVLEFDEGGKHTVSSGRATETFVLQNGRWTNPGWHTDSVK